MAVVRLCAQIKLRVHKPSIEGIASKRLLSVSSSSEAHFSHWQRNLNDFRRCWRRESKSTSRVKSKYEMQHSSPGRMSRDAVKTIRPVSSGLWIICDGMSTFHLKVEREMIWEMGLHSACRNGWLLLPWGRQLQRTARLGLQEDPPMAEFPFLEDIIRTNLLLPGKWDEESDRHSTHEVSFGYFADIS